MTPERWQKIGDLFEEALALPANERSAMVDRVAASDKQVREEVLSLLASHRAVPGGFVQKRIQSAVESFHRASTAAETPARVGPYRLIRELGRGGMGAVFLAERDDAEYRAKVAIKLVRSGMDTAFILARFRRERQTLARLQHPNISRLLDGGTSDEGLPYIVMEYIDGPWITAYAAQHQLGVEARVRLFQEVCSAVDYAHRSFIVHRDLKPGNILVDGTGVPKLVDFGICKLLVESVTGDDTVGPPMTPNYASPEQIRGEAATTSSDIYSLGVVLYELLTGSCPRRFENLTPRGIERALDRPIVRASAAAEPRLARRLAGDLDTILMRALDTDPARRYDSAAQFADDLRRHLEHLPIRARPHTLRYRAVTFMRRHRGSTAAAAAIFAALALGLAVSRQQARLADERLGQIRSLASKLVVDVDDAVRDLPGSTRARKMIVQTGLTYLDTLARSAGGDPHALTELARAYRRLGDVEGNVDSANLGDLPGALGLYQKALPLLDEATRQAPDDIEARTEQLVVRSRIATLQAGTKNLRDALQTFQDAIARAKAPAPSSDRAFRLALADAYLGAGNARRNLGDDQGAFDAATECLRLYQEAAAAERSNPAVLRGMAGALAAVGMAQSRRGQLEPALASFRQGAATLERLVDTDPRNVNWNRELMLAYGHVADVLGNPELENLGDRAGALAAYRQAAEVAKRLYEADRSDQRAAADYGIVLSRVETAMDDDDMTEKLQIQRESLRVLDEAFRVSPENVSLQIYRALVRLHHGESLTASGQIEEARHAYLESVTISEPYLKLGHASLVVMFVRANERLARNAVARGRRSEALAFAGRVLELEEKPPTDAPSARLVPRVRSVFGLTYAALAGSPVQQPADRDQALSWLHKALDAWRAAASDPSFAAPHRREMREVEEALARLERP